jgi:hypothetical protein
MVSVWSAERRLKFILGDAYFSIPLSQSGDVAPLLSRNLLLFHEPPMIDGPPDGESHNEHHEKKFSDRKSKTAGWCGFHWHWSLRFRAY